MSETAICICTKVCDCKNPPPDDWDGISGVFHVSEECPEHNTHPDRPEPHPDCTHPDCLAFEPKVHPGFGLKGVF